MAEPFYHRTDEHTYDSTVSTRGPWSPDHQHAGPPSALLGGELEAALGPGRVVRVTIEVLRPVPIAPLRVDVDVVRPGGRVALAEGALVAEDGPVLLARAWRLRTLEESGVPADPPDAPARPTPDQLDSGDFFGQAWQLPWDVGYHTAMETRLLEDGMAGPGDAFCWMRPGVPMVDDAEPTPLQRVLVAADSGNGVSYRFDPSEVLYVNTDLTVHLRELPVGTWVGLDARTRFAADGIGLATSTLHDERGDIGTSHQSLLVERR